MQVEFDNITAILDVCLERMRRGESVEACVFDYPSEAEELEPLLIAATYTRSTFRPPALAPEARQAIRRQLQQAVAARQPVQRRARWGWAGSFVMRLALALVVVFLTFGGSVAAAQRSLPGNLIYPLKRASESVRLRLASSSTQRAALHLDFAAARSAEILALASGDQKAIDSSLVDDLDQEYQLAWKEIGQAPADDVHDLVSRYVVERRADVRLFSAALGGPNAVTRMQIQRAVRLGEQALAVVAPAEAPTPRPDSDKGDTTGVVNTGDNGAPNSSPTPEGKPDNAGPKPTPEGKPDNAGPKPTPEGKPDNAGPKPTPEGKPADAGPQATPEGKPADAGPQATPEAKPDSSDPKPKPKPKPSHGKP
jgi:hypothetical protein